MGRQTPFSPLSSRAGLLFTIFTLLLCVVGATAHSTALPPIKRVHHPSRSTLRILPRHVPQNGILKRSRVVPTPNSVRYDDTVLLTVSLPSLLPYDVHLLVNPTQGLFHPDAKIVYQNGDGATTHTERLLPTDWKMYSGDVIRPSWVERSWEFERLGYGRNKEAVIGRASVMIHEADAGAVKWEGAFDIGGEQYHVLTRENYEVLKTDKDAKVADLEGGMVVFSDRDIVMEKRSADAAPVSTCGHDKLAYNMNPYHPYRVRRDMPPRLLPRGDDIAGPKPDSNYIDSIGSTAGCPTEAKIVYMGVMLDCTYVGKFGSADAARTNLLQKWNTVTDLYLQTFKISLGIIELIVKDVTCPSNPPDNERWNVDCENKMTLDSRLGYFSQWRGAKGNDNAGLWHLMTACTSDTEVGVAWLGAICQTEVKQQEDSTYVSGTGVSSATTTEWNVIAHEIGHGFGAIHDCTQGCQLTDGCCPLSKSSCDASGQYVMNPTTAPKEKNFSPCSIGNICTAIKTNNPKCIQTYNSQFSLIGLNQCGNGIVEGDEECDPGNNGTSACCENCKFKPGAKCDPSNGLCCDDKCQFRAKGISCRKPIDEQCDSEEFCTGSDAACPKDVTAKDGTSCGASGQGLSCASGHCTSLDLQCQVAGKALGLQKACGQKNDRSCTVACKDPTNDHMCQLLQAVLIDGSSCGYGGRCYNGSCKSGTWTEALDAMYMQNLNISIPVTIAVGLIILALIYQMFRCCWVRRPQPKAGPRAVTNARGGRAPAINTNTHTGYQPLDEPLLSTPVAAAPKHGHTRDGSDGSGSVTGVGAGTGVAMNQMYPDPYSQGHYGQSHDYYNTSDNYEQSYPQERYDARSPPRQNWVDERQYNGPNYGH